MESKRIGAEFKRLLAGEKTDRPLVWLWGAVPSFAVKNVGYPAVAAYNDPEKSFDAQIKTITMYGEDGIPRMAVGGTVDLTWVFGGEIKWPLGEYDMAPIASQYPVSGEADLYKISIPDNIAEAGPLPLYLDFARLCQDHNLPIFPFITSPLEGVRSICGPDLLMRWMIKRPDIIHNLLRKVTNYSVKIVRLFANIFPPDNTLIYVAAPTASNQMISPRMFETFVLPYQKELHQETLSTGIGTIFCHICGDHNKNLSLWQEVPMGDPGIVSFGHEVSLDDAISHFGKDCVIAGNIDPALIISGKPGDIYQLCKQALAKGVNAPRGFILMPGCGVPYNVPSYNLFMLKQAVEERCENR